MKKNSILLSLCLVITNGLALASHTIQANKKKEAQAVAAIVRKVHTNAQQKNRHYAQLIARLKKRVLEIEQEQAQDSTSGLSTPLALEPVSPNTSEESYTNPPAIAQELAHTGIRLLLIKELETTTIPELKVSDPAILTIRKKEELKAVTVYSQLATLHKLMAAEEPDLENIVALNEKIQRESAQLQALFAHRLQNLS